MRKLPLKKADIVLIASILLCALALFAWRLLAAGTGNAVVVSVDGHVTARYLLHTHTTVTLDGVDGQNVLVIANGTARIEEADCPDKLCVHQKAISKNHETIVCLPNKVVVEITGSEESGFDTIAK